MSNMSPAISPTADKTAVITPQDGIDPSTGRCSYLTEKVKNIWETTKDLIIAFFQSILHCRNYLYLPFMKADAIDGKTLYEHADSDNWASTYIFTKLDRKFSSLAKPEEKKEYFSKLFKECVKQDRENGTFKGKAIYTKLQEKYFPEEKGILIESSKDLISILQSCPPEERDALFTEFRNEQGYHPFSSLNLYDLLAPSVEDKKELMAQLFKGEKFEKRNHPNPYVFLVFFSLYFSDDLPLLQEAFNEKGLFPKLSEEHKDFSQFPDIDLNTLQGYDTERLGNSISYMLRNSFTIERNLERTFENSPVVEFCKKVIEKREDFFFDSDQIGTLLLSCPKESRSSIFQTFPSEVDDEDACELYRIIAPSSKEEKKTLMEKVFSTDRYMDHLLDHFEAELRKLITLLSDEELNLLGELFAEKKLFERDAFSEALNKTFADSDKIKAITLQSLAERFSQIRSLMEEKIFSSIHPSKLDGFNDALFQKQLELFFALLVEEINSNTDRLIFQEKLKDLFNENHFNIILQFGFLKDLFSFIPQLKGKTELDKFFNLFDKKIIKIYKEFSQEMRLEITSMVATNVNFPHLESEEEVRSFYTEMLQRLKKYHEKAEKDLLVKTPFLGDFNLGRWAEIDVGTPTERFSLNLLDQFTPHIKELTTGNQIIQAIESLHPRNRDPSDILKSKISFIEELCDLPAFNEEFLGKIEDSETILTLWNNLNQPELASKQKQVFETPCMQKWLTEASFYVIQNEVITPLYKRGDNEALQLIKQTLEKISFDKLIPLYIDLKQMDGFDDDILPRATISSKAKKDLLNKWNHSDEATKYIKTLHVTTDIEEE